MEGNSELRSRIKRRREGRNFEGEGTGWERK